MFNSVIRTRSIQFLKTDGDLFKAPKTPCPNRSEIEFEKMKPNLPTRLHGIGSLKVGIVRAFKIKLL